MQVGIHEAKMYLSRPIEAAAAGEEVIITKGNTPVARLVPAARTRCERTPGRLRGKVDIAPDFDTPLPEAVRNAFAA